ncbi:MAG: PBECR3 domain-containing polyvalent protein [Halothiobacillus sp.]
MHPSGVKHVQGKHGNASNELSRGQQAVSAADYARLPELLNDSDSIEDAGKSWRTGQPLVRYSKAMDGADWVVVFEVRKGRRMLVPDTFYIRKIDQQ